METQKKYNSGGLDKKEPITADSMLKRMRPAALRPSEPNIITAADGMGPMRKINTIQEEQNEEQKEDEVAQGEQNEDQGEQKVDQGEQNEDQGEQKVDQGEQKVDQGEQKVDQGEQKVDQGEQKVDQGEQNGEKQKVDQGEQNGEEQKVDQGEQNGEEQKVDQGEQNGEEQKVDQGEQNGEEQKVDQGEENGEGWKLYQGENVEQTMKKKKKKSIPRMFSMLGHSSKPAAEDKEEKKIRKANTIQEKQDLYQMRQNLQMERYNLGQMRQHLDQEKEDIDQMRRILDSEKQDLDRIRQSLDQDEQNLDRMRQNPDQEKQDLDQMRQNLHIEKYDLGQMRQNLDQEEHNGDKQALKAVCGNLMHVMHRDEYKIAEAVVNDYEKGNLPCENATNLLTLLQYYAKHQPQQPGEDLHWKKKGDQKQKLLVKSASIWIFCTVTGETFGAHQRLLDQVKHLKGLNVVECPQWQNCQVIIVFCVIDSRVGSNVEAAMSKTPDGKPVILVLMHHTRDVYYSTGGRKWSDSFDKVVLDVHVLYHQTRQGLLTCPKNQQAVKHIQEVLQRYTKKEKWLQL
ncbi:uncharacterized protein LOC142988946 isoform X2 [Genypterus blacodes]|uniref:uncharacterized protein LOC142988946 isoform X2 n=1 Tax=Genypterus blacodes TaxID=154954 RepID=UPI003F761784